jgi:hypothetical protein
VRRNGPGTPYDKDIGGDQLQGFGETDYSVDAFGFDRSFAIRFDNTDYDQV